MPLQPFAMRVGALCRVDIHVHSPYGHFQRSPCFFLSYPLFLAPLHQTLTFSISRVPFPEIGPVPKSLFTGSWLFLEHRERLTLERASRPGGWLGMSQSLQGWKGGVSFLGSE